MSPTDPVKDAVVQARRRQILEAAVIQFSEKGFHKTTIKDIARRAGIADGTIYNYFKNKQDLMVAMVIQIAELAPLMTTVQEMATHRSVEDILSMVLHNRLGLMSENLSYARAIFPQVIAQSELRAKFYDEMLKPNMRLVEQMLEHYVQQNAIRTLDSRIATRIVFAIIFGSLFLTMLGDDFAIENRSAFVEGATTFVRAALASMQADSEETAQ